MKLVDPYDEGTEDGQVDCSQSPNFPWDRRDIARVTVNGDILIFMTLIQDGNPQRIALDLDDLMGK